MVAPVQHGPALLSTFVPTDSITIIIDYAVQMLCALKCLDMRLCEGPGQRVQVGQRRLMRYGLMHRARAKSIQKISNVVLPHTVVRSRKGLPDSGGLWLGTTCIPLIFSGRFGLFLCIFHVKVCTTSQLCLTTVTLEMITITMTYGMISCLCSILCLS